MICFSFELEKIKPVCFDLLLKQILFFGICFSNKASLATKINLKMANNPAPLKLCEPKNNLFEIIKGIAQVLPTQPLKLFAIRTTHTLLYLEAAHCLKIPFSFLEKVKFIYIIDLNSSGKVQNDCLFPNQYGLLNPLKLNNLHFC